MWSQQGFQGGPPPPRHGFQGGQQQGATSGPPPPQGHGPPQQANAWGGGVQQANNSNDVDYYYGHGDEDDGALGATINLVTSAASMFFKPPAAPAPAPVAQQPSPRPSGPPPPIDPTTSMLDMEPPAQQTSAPIQPQGGFPVAAANNSRGGSMFRPPYHPSTPSTDRNLDQNPATVFSSSPRLFEPSSPRVLAESSPKFANPQIAVPHLPSFSSQQDEKPPVQPSIAPAFGGTPARSNPASAAAKVAVPMIPAIQSTLSGSSSMDAADVFGSGIANTGAPSGTFTNPGPNTSAPPATTNHGDSPQPKPPKKNIVETSTHTHHDPSPNIHSRPPMQPSSSKERKSSTVAHHRVTPPPSPRVQHDIHPPNSPTTPLMTNQTSSATKVKKDLSPKIAASSPLPTPTRRHLRAPPKKHVSPRTTTPRPKFRLPPPRKNKVAPSPRNSTDSSKSDKDKTTTASSEPALANSLRHERSAPVAGEPQTSTPQEQPVPKETSVAPSTATAETTTTTASMSKTGPPTIPGMDRHQQKIEMTTRPRNDNVDVPAPGKEEGGAPEVTTAPPMMMAEPAATDNINNQVEKDELPDGWIETVDTSTGIERVYYYNTVSQETSWDRPAAATSTATSATAEPARPEMTVSDDKGVRTMPSTTTEEEQKPDLAVHGETVAENTISSTDVTPHQTPMSPETEISTEISRVDQSADSIFDELSPEINANIGGSEENKSNDTAAAGILDETKSKEDNSNGQTAAPLPPDWVEAYDATSGRLYFYNTADQSTSWDRPSATAAAPVSNDPISDDGGNQGNETIPEGSITSDDATQTTIDEIRIQAPPEVENSGDIIEEVVGTMQNRENQEEGSPAGQPVTEASNDNIVDAKAITDLPKDWVELIDESSGNKYYFNTSNQETSWEKPTSMPQEAEATGDRHAKASDDALPPAQVAEAGPVVSPVDEDVVITNNEPEQVNSTDPSPPSHADSGSPLKLPEGWVELVEETSGRKYYYNSVLQQSSWDLLGTVETSEGDGPDAGMKDERAPESVPITDRAASPPDEGEIPEKDEPEPEKVQSTAPHEIAVEGEPPLPPDWTVEYDDTLGMKFYYNSSTNEKSWERPVENPEADAPSAETQEDYTTPVDLNDIPRDEPEKVENAADDGVDATERLPEDWIESIDDVTGQKFYYNSRTTETSWERPMATPNVDIPPDLSPAEPYEATIDSIPNEGHDASAKVMEMPTAEPEKVGLSTHDDVDAASADGDNPPTGSLPEFWVEANDESSGGRTYFYHTLTHQTSWERPQATTSAAAESEDEPFQDEDAPEEIDNEASESTEDSSSSSSSVDVDDSTSESSEDLEPEIVDGSQMDTAEDEARRSLPPDWEELVDASTGQIYYFNAKLNQTTWERPEIEPSGLSTPTEDRTTEEASEERVPEGTNEEALESDDPAVPADDAVGATEDSLPPDWEELVDDSNGQVYYFNSKLNQTTWERPEIPEIEPLGLSKAPAEDRSTEETSEERMHVSETASEEASEGNDPPVPADDAAGATEDSLPAGWIESVDEATGNVFFYNSISNESSWDRPALEDAGDGAEASPTQDNVAMVAGDQVPGSVGKEPCGSPTPNDDVALPEGWEEVADEDTNQVYYYNVHSQEVSWEKPQLPPVEEPDQTGLDDNGTGDDTGAEPVEQEQQPDLQTTDPMEDEPVAEDDNKHVPEPECEDENEPVMSSDDGGLPDNWEKVVDDSTGEIRIYYFNTVSKETTWDRPGPTADGTQAAPLTVEETAVEETTVNQDSGADRGEAPEALDGEPTEPAAPSDDGGLPKGWEELVDEASGQTFFFNSLTNETTWEKPKVSAELDACNTNAFEEHATVQAPADQETTSPMDAETENPVDEKPEMGDSEPVPPTQDVVGGLPEGWEELVDEASGQVFFFNSLTNETTWERPEVSAQALPTDEGPGNSADEKPDTEEPELEADEPIPPTQDGGPPEGWEELVDEASGQVYFFNSLTNETRWERPEVSVQPDAINPEELETEMDEEPEDSVDEQPKMGDGEPVQQTQNGGLPEGWEELVDEDSGQVYFFHSLTNETTWERPEFPADPDAVNAVEELETEMDEEPEDSADEKPKMGDGEPAQQMQDDGLPEGWEELVDEDSGQVYFFHSLTNETTWERPDFPAEPDAVNAVEELETEMGEEPEDSADEKPEMGDGEPAQQMQDDGLPEGWEELVDEDSGQVYFFHSLTNETTWERPDFPAEPDAVNAFEEFETTSPMDEEPENSADEKPEMEDGEPVPSTQDEEPENPVDEKPEMENIEPVPPTQDANQDGGLPKGWEELVDEASGQVFFFNSLTNETTWERPQVEASPVGVATEPSEKDSPSAPAAGADAGDSNAEGFVDQVEPRGAESAPPDAVTTTEATEEQSEPEGGEVGNNDPLPEGWVEAVDESSGTQLVYYYNTSTQETSWDRPSGPPSVAVSGNQTAESNDGVKLTRGESGDHFVDEYEVTSRAEDKTDDVADEGFANEYDLTTDDDVDVDVDDDDDYDMVPDHDDAKEGETARNSDGEEDYVLPEFWTEAIDDQSGRKYYFNTLTQKVSWEPPSRDTEKEMPLATEEDDDPSENLDLPPDESQDPAESSNSHGGEPAGGSDDSELPEGWRKILDEQSGNFYFYNDSTGTTSWESPTDRYGADENNEVLVEGPVSGDDKADDDLLSENLDLPPDEYQDPVESSNLHGSEGGSDHPELPKGWTKTLDEQSGKFYFYNDSTGMTSWEPPTDRADENNEVFVEGPVSGDDKAIQDDWVEVTDDDKQSDGKVATGQSLPDVRIGETMGSILMIEPELDQYLTQALEKAFVNLNKRRAEHDIVGPLISSSDSCVMNYITMKKSEEPDDILWHLISIAASSNGRLRSTDGVIDSSSPEAAIVKLLLQEEPASSGTAAPSSSATSKIIIEEYNDGDDDAQISMERIQNLLLQGERRQAVDEAIANCDFATAFLVACMCDADTYQRVANAYAERVFVAGSPMQTVCLLFSQSLQTSDRARNSHWGIAPDELSSTWKKHLAVIISNRAPGWFHVVLSLGDRLRAIGNITGAHFCFMICGCAFTNATENETRIALLGCDHVSRESVTLLSADAIAAFDRTEAYEWAKRRGNKSATIQSFLPHKLIFAMHLTDIGLRQKAVAFAATVRQSVATSSGKAIDITNLSVDRLFSDRVCLCAALSRLEEILGIGPQDFISGGDAVAVGRVSSAQFNKAETFVPGKQEHAISDEKYVATDPSSQIDDSFVTAPTNLMDKTGYSLDSPERHPRNDKAEAPTDPPLRVISAEIPGSVGPVESGQTVVSTPQISNRDSTFKMAPSPSVAKITGPPVQSAMPPMMMQTPSLSKESGPSASVGQAPLKKAPDQTPTMPPGESAASKQMLMTPKESNITLKKPKSPPATAPSVMMGKKSEKPSEKKAPSSADKQAPSSGSSLGSWNLGIRDWMIKKLNPDATACALPDNEEKAYFDKKLGVWVFPGDDPAELAKPIAPPPIIPASTSEKESTPAPAPAPSNDPLSQLMAPPPVRGLSTTRRPGALPRGIPSPGAFPGMPGIPAATPGGPSPPGGASAAPPTFAVFQPKPSSKDEKSDSK